MNSKEVGICIYCGATKGLTTEHIVPKAFGGTRTLLRASCKDCARKTSRIETFLLKAPPEGHPGILYDLRVMSGMPSRRGSTKKALLHQFKKNSQTSEISSEWVEPDAYVGVTMFPFFPEPDAVTGAVHPNGIELDGIEWQQYVSNADKAEPGYEYGSFFRSREGDFPRLLAKIAYGIAVFELGYDKVKNSPLRKLILENTPDQAKWIGCSKENTIVAQSADAVWATELGSYKGRTAVKIKFLPEFPDENPEYIVIVDPGVIFNM